MPATWLSLDQSPCLPRTSNAKANGQAVSSCCVHWVWNTQQLTSHSPEIGCSLLATGHAWEADASNTKGTPVHDLPHWEFGVNKGCGQHCKEWPEARDHDLEPCSLRMVISIWNTRSQGTNNQNMSSHKTTLAVHLSTVGNLAELVKAVWKLCKWNTKV